MSHGIELINNSGKLVVSNVSKQLSFHQKISILVPAATGTQADIIDSNHLYTITTSLSDSSKKPLVYYEPETEGSQRGYCPVRIYFSSSRWKIDIARGEAANQVVLYVFVEKNTESGGWGIQTFDVNGSLAFNSNDRPLAISGAINMTRGNDNYNNGTGNTYGWVYDDGELGDGSISVPTASRVTNYAVSVPPYFYGSVAGYPTGESSGNNEYGLGCVAKGASWALNTARIGIGQWSSFSGKPISAPIWSTIKISFIDGSMYS